jgi:serine/threonine protein kinase
MKLEAGYNLRQYRIIEPIGAGGMGEVYRAHDTNLDRDVAIKVLPRAVATNSQNLARLEREAKAIAALSHPNILAVYDFGTEDGNSFVVTELLEGETLRERLTGGALAPRKAAELGRQIARGLAAAHDKGIVHRDLKPENLFLSEDGRIKILDFGLATSVGGSDAPDATGDYVGPTRTSLTMPGSVMGTVDYMSPEQVRGEPVDHRSDIFSFGSVLYEMLGGSRPFHMETQPETMTAIMKSEPTDLHSLSGEVPPAICTIIRRCLEKRAGERFQSAHDLAFSLEAFSESSTTGGTPAFVGESAPRKRVGRAGMALLLAAGIVIGALAGFFLRPQSSSNSADQMSFAVLSARRGFVTNGRFVPGDESMIYSASWEGGPLQLYPASRGTRTSDPLNIQSADLLSISSAGELALSLDRRYPIGWEKVGTLAVARPGGAAPRPLLENVAVADWSPDGHSLAVAHEVNGVVRLEYPIGTVLYESPGWISDLRVHPDGDRILIADNPARGDNFSIVRIVDREGTVETVGDGGAWGVLWAPDGESIWYSGGGGVRSIKPGEEPRNLYQSTAGMRLLDVDPTGQILSGVGSMRREMVVSLPGSTSDTPLSWLDWTTPTALSADGRIALFEEGNNITADGYAIYMRETNGAPPLLLDFGSTMALSPDGRQVAIVKRPFGDDAELVLIPTGPGEPRILDTGDLHSYETPGGFWGPGTGTNDPGNLVFVAREGLANKRIYLLPLVEGGTVRALTPPDLVLASTGHVLSSDGKQMIVQPLEGPAFVMDIDQDGQAIEPGRAAPGMQPTDRALRYDESGNHLFVQASSTVPASLLRVNLSTGERQPWRELTPGDPAGVFGVDRVMISEDGETCVYSIRRVIMRLVVADNIE